MNFDLGKQFIYPSRDEKGVYTFLIDELVDHKHLIKTATQYHPQVTQYIKTAMPMPGKVQALITALGGGETYGPNINGDFFPMAGLSPIDKNYGHKTFEYYAKVRKHHLNKDHHPEYGEVGLSVWNEAMKRVELILIIDAIAAPDIAQDLASGRTVDWSMGAKLPYDECSICGQKSKKIADYCGHLKFYMNKIDPETGKQVYAINRFPRFFDISHVLLGADRTNATWTKVASRGQQARHRRQSSITLYDATFGKIAVDKKAEIEKKIESNIKPQITEDLKRVAMKAGPEIQDKSPDMPRAMIESLSSHGLKEVFSTLGSLGIIPKPHEFQAIMLRILGKVDLAKDLERRNICFDPREGKSVPPVDLGLGPAHVSRAVADILTPLVSQRSFSRPVLIKRIIIIKRSPEQAVASPVMVKSASADVPILAALAAMFTTIAWHSKGGSRGALDGLLMKNPALISAMGAGVIAGSRQAQQEIQKPVGFFDVADTPKPMYNTNNRLELLRKMQQRPVMLIKTSGAGSTVESRLFHGIPTLLMESVYNSDLDGGMTGLNTSLQKVAQVLNSGLTSSTPEKIKQTREALISSSRVFGKVASMDDLRFFQDEIRDVVADLSIVSEIRNM